MSTVPSLPARGRSSVGSRGAVALSAGLIYFALAALTIRLSSDGRDIASIWPANAALLALLLRNDETHWGDVLWAGFVGNGLANLVTRGNFVAPFLFGAINLVEIAVAALALRGILRQSSPIGSPGTLGQFIFWSGLVAPAISGLGGAATAMAVFGEPFLRSLETWFVSDALGLLIFTPVFLSFCNGEYLRCFEERSLIQRLEVILLQVVTAATTIVVFRSRIPLLFVLFPPVILVGFRAGRLGTQMSVMIIAVIGALATMRGIGPITLFSSDPARQAEGFQFFLAVLLLSCLPMSAGLSARTAVTTELVDRERALRADRAALARRAMTDSLTGLLNRAGLQAEAACAMAQATSLPLWLVLVDVDRFKEINDRYGHQAGDDALIVIAGVLSNVLGPETTVARIGGDEFAALFRAASDTQAQALCDRLVIETTGAPLQAGAEEVSLSISCGAAKAESGLTLDHLIRRADVALYDAKRDGRCRAVMAEAAPTA